MDCKVCFEKFNYIKNKPRLIISCGHTFCQSCLNRLQKQICPECRSNINGTVVNYAILNLINSNILNLIQIVEEINLKYFIQENNNSSFQFIIDIPVTLSI